MHSIKIRKCLNLNFNMPSHTPPLKGATALVPFRVTVKDS